VTGRVCSGRFASGARSETTGVRTGEMTVRTTASIDADSVVAARDS
jgi:hypothetical protein